MIVNGDTVVVNRVMLGSKSRYSGSEYASCFPLVSRLVVSERGQAR